MSDIFNFDRFVRTVSFDFRKIMRGYGLTALVLSLIPFIGAFLYGLLSMAFGGGWSHPGISFRSPMLIIFFFVMVLSLPVSAYGFVTDRRVGSSYLMMPTSSLEKFISMILNVVIFFPVMMGAIFLLSDSLLVLTGLADGGYLPVEYARTLNNFNYASFDSDLIDTGWIRPSVTWGACLSLAINLLFFLLGSIFFKKTKVVKTILVILGLQVLSTIVIGPFASEITDDILLGDFWNGFRVWFWLSIAVQIVVLDVLIYLRIKTLKH